MDLNKKSLKKNILIILLILLSILFLGILVFIIYYDYNNTSTPKQNLYSINVRGYTMDNEFDSQVYDYNVIVNDNVIEISCDSDSEIIGCNVSLNLIDNEVYTHQIKVYDGNKFIIYNIYIKNEPLITNNEFYIKEIKGNVFEWTNNDLTLEVIMSDNSEYMYSFDGGISWQESNQLLIKENKKFQVIAKDLNGTMSNPKNVEVDKIDKKAPQVTIKKLDSTDTKVTLEVIANDDMSGVDSISFNGSNYSEKTKYDITKTGNYYATAKDKAGNISDKIYIEIKEKDFTKLEKTYTLTLEENGAKLEKKSITCTTTEKSCEVVLPNILTNNTALGWGSTSDAKKATYSQGQKIKLTKDLTLYALTKKTYTATFNKNGADEIGATSLSCTAYNTDKCLITMPTITTKKTVIGWNTNSSATTSKASVNTKIELTNNTTYYAITKKTYTATFVNNGLDYLESSKLSCSAYNTASNCSITLPKFNKKGYFNSFWALSSSASTNLGGTTWTWNNFNQVGHSYTLTKDITLYPNFNHFHYDFDKTTYKYRTLNMSTSTYVGKSLFEFESSIPQSVITNFLNTMNSAYNAMPWLYTPGKVFVMTETTYDKHSTAYGLTHNMYASYGGDSYFTIDIKYDTSGTVVKNAIDINAILHELGHGWDSYYNFKTGKGRLSNLSDFDDLYNTLGSKLYVYSDGTKISKIETFAAMVTNYYWHVLGKDPSKGYYGLKSGYTMNASELDKLKKFMNKYIAISQNGYK